MGQSATRTRGLSQIYPGFTLSENYEHTLAGVLDKARRPLHVLIPLDQLTSRLGKCGRI